MQLVKNKKQQNYRIWECVRACVCSLVCKLQCQSPPHCTVAVYCHVVMIQSTWCCEVCDWMKRWSKPNRALQLQLHLHSIFSAATSNMLWLLLRMSGTRFCSYHHLICSFKVLFLFLFFYYLSLSSPMAQF